MFFWWWFYVGYSPNAVNLPWLGNLVSPSAVPARTKNHEPHRHSASPYSWNTILGVAKSDTASRLSHDGRSQNPENFGSKWLTVKTMELPELWDYSNYSKKNPCCSLNKWQFWSRLKTIITLVLVMCFVYIFPTHSITFLLCPFHLPSGNLT